MSIALVCFYFINVINTMKRIEVLFQQYLQNTISVDDYKELCDLLGKDNNIQNLSPELEKLWQQKPLHVLPPEVWDEKMAFKMRQHEKMTWLNGRKYWQYAAAAILLLCAGTFWLVNKPTNQQALAENIVKQDVPAGSNGAILTFDNGKTIVIDTVKNGTTVSQMSKNADAITVKGETVEYATLSTPRARQQQLTLADGTKVWLNAASSIRFPNKFIGSERVVEVTGEVYFEVVHNAKQPFKVKVANQTIEDIGTSFNISAYGNEQLVTTTLVEGKIQLSSAKSSKPVVLSPNEQVKATMDGQIKSVDANADVALATAWKNGQQTFKQASLATIMRQVERWYNVDVVYEIDVPNNLTFTGEGISRQVNLSELLKVFEKNQLHFIIDGAQKKVTVVK